MIRVSMELQNSVEMGRFQGFVDWVEEYRNGLVMGFAPAEKPPENRSPLPPAPEPTSTLPEAPVALFRMHLAPGVFEEIPLNPEAVAEPLAATEEEAKAALMQVYAARGLPAARELLAAQGVERLDQLTPEQRGAFVRAVSRELEVAGQ